MKKLVTNNKEIVLVMILLMLSTLLFAATASAAPCYLVTDLGTLGGTTSNGHDINNAGQVVGWSYVPGNTAEHAFLYSSGTMADLGTLGGNHSVGFSINNSSQIVGWSNFDVGNDQTTHAFLYSGGTMTDLNSLIPSSSGWNLFDARGINDDGQIAGAGTINFKWDAFRYDGASVVDLGNLGNIASTSNDINTSGQIAGWSFLNNGNVHAFLYDGTTMRDLGTLGGTESSSNGINDAGHVVGWSRLVDNAIVHAFLYSGGTMTDLGTLGGTYSEAFGINNFGQVVGYSQIWNGDTYAFLYSSGVMYNLQDLVPPQSMKSLTQAHGINDYGLITGTMWTPTGPHAFILTPGANVTADTNVQVSVGLQITLTFSNVVSAGTVTAGMVPEDLSAPVNFDIVGGSQYNIISDPSFSFTGQVMVCISYNPSQIKRDESKLQLIHWNGSYWETNMPPLPVDTVNKRVCGVFTSLSPLAVAEPTNAINNFSGFLSPVDNPPIVNNAKAGQAIPVIWRLTDANGQPVSDPASFTGLTSSPISCGSLSGDLTDSIEEYAGSSGLQYLGDGYWQFNWKTPKNYTGQCRKMVLTLGDGSTHDADFQFK